MNCAFSKNPESIIESIKCLERITGLEYFGPLAESEFILSQNYLDDFLEKLEAWSYEKSRKPLEDNHDIDFERAVSVLNSFEYCQLEAIRHSIDFNLELRSVERRITQDSYPSTYSYFFILGAGKGHKILGEKHNQSGYHIHYIVSKKRRIRTNVVFTFDPVENVSVDHTLYWEHHAGRIKISDPGSFGRKRKEAIYDSSTTFLNRVGKSKFMRRGHGSSIFYP